MTPPADVPAPSAFETRTAAFNAAIASLQAAFATYDLSGKSCACCGRKSFTFVNDFREAQQVEAMIKKLRKLDCGEDE